MVILSSDTGFNTLARALMAVVINCEIKSLKRAYINENRDARIAAAKYGGRV